MAGDHRTTALVTACLKTPVDPQTKAPLASYERAGAPRRDREQLAPGDWGPPPDADRLDLRRIFFSNEEYYRKLEELKEAHLRTMADLESMYQQKLLLRPSRGPEEEEEAAEEALEAGGRQGLRKSRSAADLRRSSSGSRGAAGPGAENGLLSSPKDHIRNMWRDFQVAPPTRQLSSSLRSLPAVPRRQESQPARPLGGGAPPGPGTTVPRPFQMTLREDELRRRRRGVRSRVEVEVENRELRRQLEELAECQKQFRASPVPARIYLGRYAEQQEQQRRARLRQSQSLGTVPEPFSFLERERRKKEQREQSRPPLAPASGEVPAFKAKPVPPSVYAAASAERRQEEQLYRSIKIQARAQELLQSAATPPSRVARRLSERKKAREGDGGDAAGDGVPHRPQINREVPDFEASYRCFQKQLQKRRQWKPSTAVQPFQLRTAGIPEHRERVLADLEREQSSPRERRWPFLSPGPPRTPASSLCSSLSGSLELLPAKVTGASTKRQEAVRKTLEERRKAEEEEERWREKQRQREKRLQRVVAQRAQANDPHLALSQTHQSKLKEFRRQQQQRRREHQQEMKEMQRRVMGRPLLLEQVAQKNAKQAADRRYVDALQGCDLTEEFVLSKATSSGAARGELQPAEGPRSDQDEPDLGDGPVRYRRVFLGDEDLEGSPSEEDTGGSGADAHGSDDHRSYSDDQESYSSDSDHDVETTPREAV